MTPPRLGGAAVCLSRPLVLYGEAICLVLARTGVSVLISFAACIGVIPHADILVLVARVLGDKLLSSVRLQTPSSVDKCGAAGAELLPLQTL